MSTTADIEKPDNRPRIPFALKVTGTWNGDIFEDWYRRKPTKPELGELELWRCLHDWEKNIHETTFETIIEKVRKAL